MTEYPVSPQRYQEFMTANERTAYWVRSHGSDAGFYSPSVPPPIVDDRLIPSAPPSETGSTHSTPPKMVLRYNDGRPDVPIPRVPLGPSHINSDLSRSRTMAHNPYAKPGLNNIQPYSRPGLHGSEFQAPEEIRILPSFGPAPTSSSTSRPGHSRSKSLPRSAARARDLPAEEVPFMPPPYLQSQSPYPQPQTHLNPHGVSNSTRPSQSYQNRQRSHPKHPPPVVYNSQRPQYASPAMFHHPPQMGPNGVVYSHSAPVQGQYPPAYPAGYPHPSSTHEVRGSGRGRSFDRSRTVGRPPKVNPEDSALSLASQNTGSTYYVLPSNGQKVHVINPSPEQSVVTATSTTKSNSPHVHTFGKKPFFQRLFGFAKFSSAGPTSSGGGRLRRRHSFGTSA